MIKKYGLIATILIFTASCSDSVSFNEPSPKNDGSSGSEGEEGNSKEDEEQRKKEEEQRKKEEEQKKKEEEQKKKEEEQKKKEEEQKKKDEEQRKKDERISSIDSALSGTWTSKCAFLSTNIFSDSVYSHSAYKFSSSDHRYEVVHKIYSDWDYPEIDTCAADSKDFIGEYVEKGTFGIEEEKEYDDTKSYYISFQSDSSNLSIEDSKKDQVIEECQSTINNPVLSWSPLTCINKLMFMSNNKETPTSISRKLKFEGMDRYLKSQNDPLQMEWKWTGTENYPSSSNIIWKTND